MKMIALKLPDELLTKIEHTANKRGKTRSAVMREALEDFLSDNRNLYGAPAWVLHAILPDACKPPRICQEIRRICGEGGTPMK
ncbi:ribbon-helix-helix protein, CopG family [Desulforhabdus sp. TSK]|uniref:ribbon-helix-helix protein, CopG family n=1 Tax=Desulforhabdus sp. TSK TaxID=2925014 RepID=UPI00208C923D|nr:hypothetical protein DSTSK_28300 [Desulforhabdus sp. TSK]